MALTRNGTVLAQRNLESDKHVHAEKLNVFVDEVMQESACAMNAISAIAVGIGPGSYTGLRIGLSAAKGFSYALQVPIMGISTLHTLVAQAREHAITRTGTCWPMIDARRMEVFTQPMDFAGAAHGTVRAVILDPAWAHDNRGSIVFGDGAEKAGPIWQEAGIDVLEGVRPVAASMATEAFRRYQAQEFDDLAYLVPNYGKAANVTQPRKRSAL